jgi:hypothetical protein
MIQQYQIDGCVKANSSRQLIIVCSNKKMLGQMVRAPLSWGLV